MLLPGPGAPSTELPHRVFVGHSVAHLVTLALTHERDPYLERGEGEGETGGEERGRRNREGR